MPYKIWVKYGDGQSVKIIFNEGDVDDLKKSIKNELPEQFKNISISQITLRKQGEEVDLDPELKVDERFVNNSKTPVQIFVKSHEKVDERWGGKVRNPMFNTQKQGFDPFFKVVYFVYKKLFKTYLELSSQPLIEYLQDVFCDASNNNIFNEIPSVKAQDLFHVMPVLEKKHDEVVSFKMLWAFYTAGLEVYYRCNMSDQQIGGTISSAKVKVERSNKKEVLIFQIKIKVVDYDGHGFKYCSVTRNIEEFEGDRNFFDLPVVSLDYAEKSNYLKGLINENGKLFFDLAKGTHYKSYEGSLIRWKQVGGCLCDIELLGENGYLKKNDEYFAPALVYGFSFALKVWGQFNVSNVKEIIFSIDAFNDLVMIPEKKDILKYFRAHPLFPNLYNKNSRNEYHLPIHPVLDRVRLTSKYVTFIRNKYSKQVTILSILQFLSILEGFKLATRTPAMSFTADSISSPQSTSYPSFI
ncbi:P-loop containing nucleoside triphosphate hydrolase protein [Rhizophagus clarus]|uniref:P-loop containing nucleoside triphosphate hydrolase protein n=1 Tax=Rhizophagus clarus TaxID=94130 RepID=A0A8H3QWF0_9GLOM|nr:P-loop containing nucleoside triphosphate hydrolase protein [Rhizophagus clarus]